MFIFIDESGDLGFDLSKPGTSSHFVITALALECQAERKTFEKGVERTLKNKINIGKSCKNPALELKGSKTSIEVKRYFWRQVEAIPFSLYSVSLQKDTAPPVLTRDTERLYNYLARKLVDLVPIDRANPSLYVKIDKCKSSIEREEFNKYLEQHIKARLSPKVNASIEHVGSETSKGVQAADVFCWGIARKNHRDDREWYDVFSGKIAHELNELIAI